MKQKTKQTLKTILLSVLGVGAIVGVASGINTLVEKNDTELKTIHPTFSIGGLNEADGKYEKSDSTLYTKDAFECQGLEIKLDFDNYIKYQVFFYEEDGDFMEATSVFEGNAEINVPTFASHARIELTPNWAEMGEDYVNEKDQIVKWYEAPKYASQIEVKVNKEQNGPYTILSRNNLFEYQGIGDMSGTTFTPNEESNYAVSKQIDVTAYDYVLIEVPTELMGGTFFAYGLGGSNGTLGYEKTDDTYHEVGDISRLIFKIDDSTSVYLRASKDNAELLKQAKIYGITPFHLRIQSHLFHPFRPFFDTGFCTYQA